MVIQNWGLEVSMATLLIAAFQAVNVLSLVYMLFIALGQCLPPRARQNAWKHLILPVLCLVLVWQYATLLGWPPFVQNPTGTTIPDYHAIPRQADDSQG